ncbi:DUF6444 domain-containing protein [Methanolobus psychrotolerans]
MLDKNGRNSSKPPSTDFYARKNHRSEPEKKSDRSAGG